MGVLVEVPTVDAARGLTSHIGLYITGTGVAYEANFQVVQVDIELRISSIIYSQSRMQYIVRLTSLNTRN